MSFSNAVSPNSSLSPRHENMSQTYANSDVISSFYLQQKQPQQSSTAAAPTAGTVATRPTPQVAPQSAAGEYASLCIAMSSPVDHRGQTSMTTSQARLRPALYRLSDGFDYDLANPGFSEQTQQDVVGGGGTTKQFDDNNLNYHNNNIPQSRVNNRNSLTLNAADLDNATALLDQVAGPVTYGEYASTAVAIEPSMLISATGYQGCDGAVYTSEEDELDEVDGADGMTFRSPAHASSSMAPPGNSNSQHSYNHRSQIRSFPVESNHSGSITDENRPTSFSLPQSTLSTFSSNATASPTSSVSSSKLRTKSGGVASGGATDQLCHPVPASPAASNSVNTSSTNNSMATAGSGLQALKVRRQMIEAALSGGSGSVASPVVPSAPSVPTSAQTPVAQSGNVTSDCTSTPINNNANNNNICLSSGARKDVGHLDMSQYSNLEGKVGAGASSIKSSGISTASAAKNSSVSQQDNSNNKSSKLPSSSAATLPPLDSGPSSNASARNKLLTSSSRKGKSSSKDQQTPPQQTELNQTNETSEAMPMPPLPISELSERLAREAKAIAGRRSMALGSSTTAPSASLSTSTTASSVRQPTPLTQTSTIMSQSLHVAAVDSSAQNKTLLEQSRIHGPIRWTKIIENGKRIKKAWTIYYSVFVTAPIPRLLFFKDEKSASKSQLPPVGQALSKPHLELTVPSIWSVCAQSDLPPKLQFTRRKNVLFLAAPFDPLEQPIAVVQQSSGSSNNNNSSPDSVANTFPDVSLGFLIECPNNDLAEEWLRSLQQSGSLLKYCAPNAASSSPPTQPKDSNNQDNSGASLSAADSTRGESLNVKAKSKALVPTAGGTGPKTSLMKLLTGFFKRRPTIADLKKKGYIRDTIFGSNLESICKKDRSDVPSFVMACVEEIESRGLDTDGLYRTSGNLAQVQKLRCMVDQGQSIAWDKWEIAVLTGALKMFFRELRDPLITTEVYDKLTEYATRPDMRRAMDPAGREAYLRRCLAMLPAVHFSTARFLFGHFVHVLEHSSQNRMELQSLAIVVAPNLMAPHTDVRSVATHALLQKYIAEDLIQFYYNVFFTPQNELPPQQQQQHQQQPYISSPVHGQLTSSSNNVPM